MKDDIMAGKDEVKKIREKWKLSIPMLEDITGINSQKIRNIIYHAAGYPAPRELAVLMREIDGFLTLKKQAFRGNEEK